MNSKEVEIVIRKINEFLQEQNHRYYHFDYIKAWFIPRTSIIIIDYHPTKRFWYRDYPSSLLRYQIKMFFCVNEIYMNCV